MKNLFTIIFLLMSYTIAAQVGINVTGANPDQSAMLDVSASDKGFLMPRLTTIQRDAIQNPAVGLMIFNLDSDCVEVYFGVGQWKSVQCGCTTAPTQPSGIIGVTDACLNQTGVNYSVPSQNGVSSYTWFSSESNDVINGQGTNSITVDFVGAGSRTLSVVANNSCGVSDTTTLVIDSDDPNSSFTPLSGTINQNTNFIAQTYAGATYTWTFDQGTPASSTVQNSSSMWTVIGQYDVTLSIVTANGCTSQTTQQVNITDCPPFNGAFVSCGQTGSAGPSQGQCNGAYSGTSLDGFVTVNSGIQQWVVPYTGTYLIEAAGAKGADSGDPTVPGSSKIGGNGAIVSARVNLNAGQTLKIVVGQEGLLGSNSAGNGGGGGGGGSFVVDNTNSPIIVAGGGGGGSTYLPIGNQALDGQSGSTSTSGTGSAGGGSNGNGGNTGNGTGGAGGGGFLTNGGTGSYGTGGNAFLNNAVGGAGYSNVYVYVGDGGFGGGGGAGFSGGGGGGGYSGGGGGANAAAYATGGGGSYIDVSATNVSTSNGLYNGSATFNGNSITNLNSYNSGHGYVTINLVCP